MKIRYPVIGAVIIIIILQIAAYLEIDTGEIIWYILPTLLLVCLGLIIYLIIRNIIRAIKAHATKK